jgi:D-alanyl-D-alanine carboxypeptidase
MTSMSAPAADGPRWTPRRLFWLLGAVLVLTASATFVGRELLTDGSSSGRAELQQTLDRLVEGDDRIAPGATAYVSGPNGIWTGSAGLANVESGTAMQPDARMRLESVSKAWTATLVLQLVQQGRMTLDETVERWLPGLLPFGDRITVRQLLNHTSGLVDTNDVGRDPLGYIGRVRDPALRAELLELAQRLEADPAYQFSPLVWVELAGALPLLSAPGTTYHYSNIGYEVAGLVVERAARAKLATLYRTRIAEPLALASATYDPGADIAGPHARGYAVAEAGELVEVTAWGTGGKGAEGGIVASASDEARFLKELMKGRLLAPAQLAAMKEPSAASGEYGLGLQFEALSCGIAYGHNGAGAGFKTGVLVSGDGARVVVLLLNGNTSRPEVDTIIRDALTRLYCAA